MHGENQDPLSGIPDRPAPPPAESPLAAPDLAPPEPPRRSRRLVALALVVALAAVATVGARHALKALQKPAPRPFEPAVEVDRSVYLPPIKTERSPSGEETSPFTGFAVTVETVPPGAVISIGGKVRGEAPVLASVECRGTEKVEVVAVKKGFRPSRRELGCRADTLVKLTLRLER